MITKDELKELGFKDGNFLVRGLKVGNWTICYTNLSGKFYIEQMPVQEYLNIETKAELQTLIKILQP